MNPFRDACVKRPNLLNLVLMQLNSILKFFASIAFLLLTQAKAQAQVKADFSSSKSSGCTPVQINFSDISTGNPDSWLWDLGNGNTSTQQNPSALYITAGNFTVSLIVGKNGIFNTIIKPGYVNIYEKPQVVFSADTVSGCGTLTVNFSNSTSSSSSNIVSQLWDFGDGITSSDASPTHIYSLPGSFTVTLVATDSAGCVASMVMPNYIEVTDQIIGSFSSNITESCLSSLSANFVSTISAGSGNYTYLWDFGDGTTSTVANPNHLYTNVIANNYTVTLTVSDGTACIYSETKTDYIKFKKFTTDFSADNQNGCINSTILFTDLSSSQATTWQWNFGDGTFSTLKNPSKKYLSSGNYTVSLKSAFAGICSDSIVKSNYIIIAAGDTANFSGSNLISCNVPHSVLFTDLTVGGQSWLWNFGDGITSTLQNPTHIYTTNGSFTVSLKASTATCTTTRTIKNYVKTGNPVAAFVNSIKDGCFPHPVTFFDKTVTNEPIAFWNWDFGDGNTSTLSNPIHTYLTGGNFTVRLIVETANGCKDTVNKIELVKTGPTPIVDFSATPLVYCVGQPVSFVNTTQGGLTYLWDFGDGGTSTLENPIHMYTNQGFYDVTLTVFNNGCKVILKKLRYIEILPPYANFTFTQDCSSYLDISFINNSKNFDSVNWDFGDGTTSTATAPSHTYSSIGSYNVILTVTNNNGCTAIYERIIVINIPDAAFGADKFTGCSPLTVAFRDSSISASTWLWDFGDGKTSTLKNPTHIFNNAGIYTVKLFIRNFTGCQDSMIRQNFIVSKGPTTNFSSDKRIGCLPFSVNFINTSGIVAPIISYQWSFGDGDSSTLENPTHTYITLGNYDVSLLVTDADGCSRTLIKKKFINLSLPNSSFTIDKTISCTGQDIIFTNTAVDTNQQYLWNFGDGKTSTNTNAIHRYVLDGVYKVSLTVTDSLGCDSTFIYAQSITIANPIADFQNSPNIGNCPPFLVNFTDNSLNGPISWKWDFGDGSTSQTRNPVKIYTAPGEFDVRLIITSSTGCTDTIIKQKTVIVLGPIGTFDFTPKNACIGINTAITFTASSANATIFTWDFGDGSIGNGATISHTYLRSGVFHPVLIMQDDKGCVFSIKSPDSIQIDLKPIPNFTTDNSIVCKLTAINFSNTTVNPSKINTWFWDFGDGDTSTLMNPTHSFANAGKYTVMLKAINYLGCVDSIIKSDEIEVKEVVFDIFPNTTGGCAPLLINFNEIGNNLASHKSIFWDFGDGQSSTLLHPDHLYKEPGRFVVKLTVTGSTGCVEKREFIINVDQVPIADFTLDDNIGCVSNIVRINNKAFGASFYKWNFGDGNSSNETNPIHTYTKSGDYFITQIVNNESGCEDTISQLFCVVVDMTFYAPDAFSPNGDGVNEEFKFYAYSFTEFDFYIMDRWGREVFATNSDEITWNGMYKGSPAMDGVYIYVARGKDLDGNELVKKGTIVLTR